MRPSTISLPGGIAVDASDNVWVVGPSGLVTELSNSGAPRTPTNGFNAAAQFIPTFIAIDPSGNIWLETETQRVVEMSTTGALLGSYSCGIADETDGIAIDGQGNKWASGGIYAQLSDLPSSTCITVSVGLGIPGLTSNVIDFAIDGAGRVWSGAGAIDGSGNVWWASDTAVSELVGAATPVVTPLATGVKNNTLGSRP